jgi:hypothetical protein
MGQTIDYAYAPILKWDDNGDGTINVYGQVSGTELDRDRQRMNATFLKNALPAWFSEGANIREQHNGKIVAGVGIELEQGANDKWWLKSHVIDPSTVLKVKHKALRGYSVAITGGQVVKSHSAPAGEITGGSIYEVSLVDRPSNPHCGVTIVKAAGAGGTIELTDAATAEWETDEMLTLAEYKAATRTVDDLLAGRVAESWSKADGGTDVGAIEDTVAQVATLVQHEAAELAATDLAKGHDIAPLLRAVEALATLIEPGEPGAYSGVEPAVIRAAAGADGVELVKSAFAGFVEYRTGVTVNEAGEIIKAAGTLPDSESLVEDNKILKAQLATAQEKLSQVEQMPRVNAPMLVRIPAQTTPITKSANTSEAERMRVLASSPNIDPAIARTLLAAAEKTAGGDAS